MDVDPSSYVACPNVTYNLSCASLCYVAIKLMDENSASVLICEMTSSEKLQRLIISK